MRNLLSRIVWASACVFALALGCGKSDEGQKAADKVAPAMQELIDEICDLSFRCCNRGEINYYIGPFVSAANCGERFMQSTELSPGILFAFEAFPELRLLVPNLGAITRAVEEGRIKVNEEQALMCLEHITEQKCNKAEEDEEEPPACIGALLDYTEEELEDDPCDPELIFEGELGEGDECTSGTLSLECYDGLVCRQGIGLGIFGECVKPAHLHEPCFSDVECDDDLYCSAHTGTCEEFRKRGEACLFADRDTLSPSPATALIECREGLSCDPVTETCVLPCERGATCQVDEQCDADEELLCIAGRCDHVRAEDLPCEEDADCDMGLRCAQDPEVEDEVKTICVGLLENGKPCQLHGECKSSYCNMAEGLCAPQLKPDEICESGDDAQCKGGACVPEDVICTTDDDCPRSGKCNLLSVSFGQCMPTCVELRPDGATCGDGSECSSGVCIVGFCRTPPLERGENCNADEQCESGHCGRDPDPDERKCVDLPLDLGDYCDSPDQCESGVCYQSSDFEPPQCTAGLAEGEPCGQPDSEPCNPKKYFCDDDEDPPKCAEFLETGHDCENSVQCRGECVVRFNRQMCSSVPDEGKAVCDGE